MFKEIGKKIKTLASVLCTIEIVLFIIAALVLFFMGFVAYGDGVFYFLIGLACAVLGPLFSWLANLTLYGFGELIDKVCDIEKNTRPGNTYVENTTHTAPNIVNQ